MSCEHMTPSRRAVLGASGALFAWAFMPRFAHAAGNRDARFVTIILRGALDGLTAVPPIGDRITSPCVRTSPCMRLVLKPFCRWMDSLRCIRRCRISPVSTRRTRRW